jgi:hypothetical protein
MEKVSSCCSSRIFVFINDGFVFLLYFTEMDLIDILRAGGKGFKYMALPFKDVVAKPAPGEGTSQNPNPDQSAPKVVASSRENEPVIAVSKPHPSDVMYEIPGHNDSFVKPNILDSPLTPLNDPAGDDLEGGADTGGSSSRASRVVVNVGDERSDDSLYADLDGKNKRPATEPLDDTFRKDRTYAFVSLPAVLLLSARFFLLLFPPSPSRILRVLSRMMRMLRIFRWAEVQRSLLPVMQLLKVTIPHNTLILMMTTLI